MSSLPPTVVPGLAQLPSSEEMMGFANTLLPSSTGTGFVTGWGIKHTQHLCFHLTGAQQLPHIMLLLAHRGHGAAVGEG